MTRKSSESKFSRLCDVDGLGRELVRIEFDPNEAELAGLRDRLNVQDVKFLQAKVELQRQENSTLVDVHVAYKTVVVQQCVVKLEPVEQEIEEEFSVLFAEAEDLEVTPVGVEIVHTLEDDDPPDMIVDGKIDVADVIAEYIALALDPYPRTAEVADEAYDAKVTEAGQNDPLENSENERIYPFANLKEMMEKK